MGLTFTQVPVEVQEALQKNAGILLTEFNPRAVIDATYKSTMRENILLATNGGVQFTDTPEYADGAEGIDNMPTNTAELKEISGREVKCSGTGKSVSSEAMVRLMGAASKETDNTGLTVFTPTDVLGISHFKTLWYVCDYGTKGGFIAIEMKRTLNTDGFSMQTANKDKGDFAFGFVAHYSIDNIDEVPYKIYMRSEALADSEELGSE